MLKIKNLETGETTDLNRDVATSHPEWVHAQIGTNSESEIQFALDGIDKDDYLDTPDDPDDMGVFISRMDALDKMAEQLVESLPNGFMVDWTEEFSFTTPEGSVSSRTIGSLSEAEEWAEDCPPFQKEAADAAVGYFDRAEDDALRAAAIEECAVNLLKDGDHENGIKKVRKAADIEAEYGDCPTYRICLDIIRRYEMIRDY